MTSFSALFWGSNSNLLCACITGVDIQTVTIVSTPNAAAVSGSTYDYPILSSVNLTCMVTSNDGLPVTATGYSWDITGCIDNNRMEKRCFPRNQITASVSEDSLLARDSGTIRCIATVDGTDYTSDPFTLRITGMWLLSIVVMCGNDFLMLLIIMIILSQSIVYHDSKLLDE